jgi:hypothetical protein
MCYERRRAEAFVDESAQKTPGWLVQDPTTSPSGDLIPTIRGSGAHPGRGCVCVCGTSATCVCVCVCVCVCGHLIASAFGFLSEKTNLTHRGMFPLCGP